MKTNKTLLLLLLGILFFIPFCKKPSTAVFDNPKDPENAENFIPDRPSGLKIAVQDSMFVLTWADSSQHEAGYLIEWQKINETSWNKRRELVANTVRWIDSLPPSFAIRYRVSSFQKVNTDVLFEPGDTVSFNATPTLTSYQVVSNNQIKASWKLNSSIFRELVLESSTNGTSWKREDKASRFDTTKTFTLTQSYLGQTLSFRLVGISGSRSTEASNTISMVFDPAVPSNFAISPVDTTLLLSWTQGKVDGYLLEYKKPSETVWKTRAELAADAVSYKDVNPPSLSIDYRLTGITGSGSTRSTLTGLIASFDGRPVIKTAFAWSATQGRVGWQVPNKIHKGIIIQTSYDGLNWTNNSYHGRIDTAKVFSFSDSQINKMVSIRLIAYTSNRYSEPSLPQTISFEIGPPKELTVAFLSDSSFKVIWAQSNRLHEQVELQYREENGIWSNSMYVGLDTTSYTMYSSTLLKHAVTYFWRARTKSGTEVSPWAEYSKVFHVGEIQQVTTEIASDDAITLYWSASGDFIEQTEILRSENNQVPVLLTTAAKGINNVELTDQKFIPNVTYRYTIRPKSKRATGTPKLTDPFVFKFDKPSDFTITTLTNTSATITWKLNSMGQTKIDIKRALASDTTTWTTLANLSTDAQSYTTTNLGTSTWIYKLTVAGNRLSVNSKIKLVPPTNMPVVSVLHTLDKHKDNVRAIALSKDGTMLVSGGDDDSVRIWNMATAQQVRAVKRSGNITALDLSPDKSMIAVNNNTQVSLINVSDGTIIRSLGNFNSGSINSIQFSPSGLGLLISDGRYGHTFSYRVSDGTKLKVVDAGIVSTLSEDGISAFLGEGFTLYEYDASGMTPIRTKSDGYLHNYISDIKHNPKKTILAISNTYETTNNSYKSITMRNYTSWDTLRTYKQYIGVNSMSFSPDGNYLAFGGNESNLKILRVSDARLVGSFAGHIGIIYKVIWSPTGNRIVTSSDDGTIKIWEVSANASSWTLEQP